MPRCTVCRRLYFLGYIRGQARFCSLYCLTYTPRQAFCQKCIDETTDKTAGDSVTINEIGVVLEGSEHRCFECHSVVQRQIFKVIVPVSARALYRVKYVSPNRYFARKLRDDVDPSRRTPPTKLAPLLKTATALCSPPSLNTQASLYMMRIDPETGEEMYRKKIRPGTTYSSLGQLDPIDPHHTYVAIDDKIYRVETESLDRRS